MYGYEKHYHDFKRDFKEMLCIHFKAQQYLYCLQEND
jgi:hypothetical protein